MKIFIKRLLLLLRLPFFKLRKNSIGLTTEIGCLTYMRGSRIGKWCYIGPRGTINCASIGNYTCIAPSCQIGGMEHSHWNLSMSPLLSEEYVFGKQTTIGHDVWIAADCIVRQGVTIGDGAVIGANSFVNKDIPPYAVAFGTPAKVVRFRFTDETIRKLNDSHYWEYEPQKARKILETINEQLKCDC